MTTTSDQLSGYGSHFTDIHFVQLYNISTFSGFSVGFCKLFSELKLVTDNLVFTVDIAVLHLPTAFMA